MYVIHHVFKCLHIDKCRKIIYTHTHWIWMNILPRIWLWRSGFFFPFIVPKPNSLNETITKNVCHIHLRIKWIFSCDSLKIPNKFSLFTDSSDIISINFLFLCVCVGDQMRNIPINFPRHLKHSFNWIKLIEILFEFTETEKKTNSI